MVQLRAEALACHRGGRVVFTDVNFALASGQLLELRGPNGAGKSSLLRLIAGLGDAAEGTIGLEGGSPELSIGQQAHYAAHQEAYGDTSVLSTKDFLYGLEDDVEHTVTLEQGVTLLIELEAISEPDERGYRTVLASLNGQLRPITVRDQSVETDVKATEKADRGNSRHVAAPFAGVVTLQVGEGEQVSAGQTVATIEAMKMEASITAQRAGTVGRLAIGKVQQVEGGDLLIELE